MKKIALLIIDGQYDFCNPQGSLFVLGADGVPVTSFVP
jgi:nicotinamidase-related amidase